MKRFVAPAIIVFFFLSLDTHAGLFDKIGNEWNRAREKHIDPIGDKVYGPSSAERENIKRREQEAEERARQEEIRLQQEEQAAIEQRKKAEERAANAGTAAQQAEEQASIAENDAKEAEAKAAEAKRKADEKEKERIIAQEKLAAQVSRLESIKEFFSPGDQRIQEIDAMLKQLEAETKSKKEASE